ncbi:MAG: hypothetical protein K2K09_02055, partial [Lachnospiraceae bacterium]|nr:hypothetical protein [Lachnospiraceae bacterium]
MKKSMKMILKRFTVTVIAAAFAFPLAACSGKEDSQEAESRYVFHEKFALAEDREISESNAYFLKDDKLYYVTEGEYDESLDMCNQYVNMCNLSDGTVTELFPVTPDDSKPEDGGSVSAWTEAIKAEDNGDITVIMYSCIYDDRGKDLGETLKKYTYSSEGKMKDVCDIDISGPNQDEDYYIVSCRLSRQGEIYVLLDIWGEEEVERERLCKCNPDGSQAENFMLDERGITVKDIILDSNDMPIAIYDKDPEGSGIYTMAAYFDMEKGVPGAGLDGIASGKDDMFRSFSVYSGGSDNTFLINDKMSLSEYDNSTGAENVICNWMDCGLSGSFVLYAVKCGNGNIFCLY